MCACVHVRVSVQVAVDGTDPTQRRNVTKPKNELQWRQCRSEAGPGKKKKKKKKKGKKWLLSQPCLSPQRFRHYGQSPCVNSE